MNGLGRDAPAPEGRQRVESRVVPVGHYAPCDEALDLPLGDDGVLEVQPAILPLHGAVQVQRIAQPVVGRTSAERRREKRQYNTACKIR